jgi:hypothetical protein
VLGILHARDDGNLAFLLRAIQVRRRADEREQVRVAAGVALIGPAYASGLKSILSGASMSITSARSTIFSARDE